MKKDDKKMLTLVAAVAAVGAFFYYRKRKKATAVAEASGERLRYNAEDLRGLQIDINVGDYVDIVSAGGPTQPNWQLAPPEGYPEAAINLVGDEGVWVWSIRGSAPTAGPGGGLPPLPPGGTVVVGMSLINETLEPPDILNFSLKIHAQ